MEGLNLISSFADFKEQKSIDRPTMMSVLEDVFRSQLEKMYGETAEFDIIINCIALIEVSKRLPFVTSQSHHTSKCFSASRPALPLLCRSSERGS